MMNYFAKRIVNVEFNEVCSSLEATIPRLREFMVEKLRHGQHVTWSDRAKGVRDLVSGAINIEMDKACKPLDSIANRLKKPGDVNWKKFHERFKDAGEKKRHGQIMNDVKDELVAELERFMGRHFGAEEDWLLLRRIVKKSQEPFFRDVHRKLMHDLSTTYVKLFGADHLRMLQKEIYDGEGKDPLVNTLVFRYIEEKNGLSNPAANALLAKAIFDKEKTLYDV